MIDGSYICGEHSRAYKFVKSLCCTYESNVTLYIKYTLKKKTGFAQKNTYILTIFISYHPIKANLEG